MRKNSVNKTIDLQKITSSLILRYVNTFDNDKKSGLADKIIGDLIAQHPRNTDLMDI